MIKNISRITLICIWIYHGLVPKILFKNEQEVLMNSTFMPFLEKHFALISSGIAEMIYALLLLIFFNSVKILYPAILFTILATIAVIIKLPGLLTQAFNPFTLNIAVCSLCIINIVAMKQKQ